MVNEKIKAAEENLIHVYNRFPIALERGEGVYLYDTNGKKYLDFAAGFAVSGLFFLHRIRGRICPLLHHGSRR